MLNEDSIRKISAPNCTSQWNRFIDLYSQTQFSNCPSFNVSRNRPICFFCGFSYPIFGSWQLTLPRCSIDVYYPLFSYLLSFNIIVISVTVPRDFAKSTIVYEKFTDPRHRAALGLFFPSFFFIFASHHRGSTKPRYVERNLILIYSCAHCCLFCKFFNYFNFSCCFKRLINTLGFFDKLN